MSTKIDPLPETDPFRKAFYEALQANLPTAYPVGRADNDPQSATETIRAGMYFFSNYAVAKEFLARASERELVAVARNEGAKMAVDLVEYMRGIVETYDEEHGR